MTTPRKDYFSLFVLLALGIGFILPSFGKIFSPYAVWFLAGIFFLSSLKIDLGSVKTSFVDIKTTLFITVMTLVVVPSVVFLIAQAFVPALLVPLVLLAVMPAGMTAPLIAEISGGKESLALVITVISSLLAPVTVPLMIKFLLGKVVVVSFLDMFLTLLTVVVVPFVLAQLTRRFLGTAARKARGWYRSISILMLLLLIVGVVAKQAELLILGFLETETVFLSLIILFLFFIILHIFGYLIVFWKHHEERIATTVCLVYMNFTLAIVLADQFFPEPAVVLPVIISVIPWSVFLGFFKSIAPRFA